MKTENLLNKYFEGETSCEEERELRRRFMEDENLPEELKVYRPFFGYFEQEADHTATKKKQTGKSQIHKYFLYGLGGIAASLVILLGGNGIYRHIRPTGNYVVIDGKRYTDNETIREQARLAFSDVCFTQEDIFDNLFE